jgi:hypothetical protein
MVVPGELVGIQIGSSNSAVTPTDYRLASRIPHGRRARSQLSAVRMPTLDWDNNTRFYKRLVRYLLLSIQAIRYNFGEIFDVPQW